MNDFARIDHAIALGENAHAAKPFELVLQVPLVPKGEPVRMSTIMTPDEYAAIKAVVERLAESAKIYLELEPC